MLCQYLATKTEFNVLSFDLNVTFFYYRNPIPQNSLNLEILTSDRELQWTVPSFPVLTVPFKDVEVKIENKEESRVLIQKDQQLTACPATYTSHCHISFSGKQYLVLWKIQNVNNFICGGDDLSYLDVSHSSDEDERND
jgi:hypothetical protein